MQDQVTALLARDPAAHAALDDPIRVSVLLDTLRKADAQDQVTALLARDPAGHAALEGGVHALARSLRAAGAHAQATALAARAAGQAPLDDNNPYAVRFLLDSLQKAGAHEQAAALASRLPAAGMFGLFTEQDGLADQFRFGREADGTPAAPWDLADQG